MTQTLAEVVQDIINTMEPEEFLDRLNIEGEELEEYMDMSIEDLCELFIGRIETSAWMFEDSEEDEDNVGNC